MRAKQNQRVEIKKGSIYLHNKSGVRKASGSYYTKTFAVEHLLEYSLVPALQDHLSKLDKMGEADAAEMFFDFRVADIAMGSGHFLIGAIDRIEAKMTDYLASRFLPGIKQELEKLRLVAQEQINEWGGGNIGRH